MPPKKPIIVLADDLSGAAELAAIAAARGLTTEVHRQFDPSRLADVVAIDTDSRNLSPDQAATKIRAVVAAHPAVQQAHIFKKIDSVLRGQPRAEIEALLQSLNRSRAIFVPANPSRGRTIVAGQYYIDGIPLQETAFADDEEHPRRSSSIATLLGPAGDVSLYYGRGAIAQAACGIVVPDANCAADIHQLAGEADDATLAAGAADFFAAMLDRWCPEPHKSAAPIIAPIKKPALLVCGSLAAWRTRRSQCLAANIPVITAHDDICDEKIAHQLRQTGALAIATIDGPVPTHERQSLLARLAQIAGNLIDSVPPSTLLLEGGATAAAVVSERGWQHFSVDAATTPGVGFLRAIEVCAAPLLLIKPGSYPWPVEIWQSFRP